MFAGWNVEGKCRMVRGESQNLKILISGAGIAGPTLAYWLLRYGFEPTLIEHAPALRTGGYIIDFWGIGFDVAEKMDLLPDMRKEGYAIDEIRFVDANGKRAGGFNVSALQPTLKGRYLSIMRSDLARIIYESLGGRVRTIFGDSIAAVENGDDGVRVTFNRAAPERYDLVIGADGLHSRVRELAFGPEARFEKYLGYYTASFGVDGYSRRDPGAYVSFPAPGRQVSRYSLRGDRTVFFFVFSRETKLTIGQYGLEEQKKILREVFGKDGWECPGILNALDARTDLYFDSISQVRMDTWSSGRAALVGDACFCPSLLAGQGSALAMAGAYILAGELKQAGGDHRIAFRKYENYFRDFITGKQQTAEKFAGSFAPKTNFGIFFRNQVTHLMGLPFVAKLTMKSLLADSLPLPNYD